MVRPVLLATSVFLFNSAARAQDAIPSETVDAVKRATVFLRVQGPNWKATGSGFVIGVGKDSVLVATNYHVIAPPDFELKPKLPPADFIKSLKQPAVAAVFDGGMRTELSSKAEVLAADPQTDLAIVRITGLKKPPTPIDIAGSPKLTETMAVYTFGYPFGQALATGKGAPSITVGKGSISSLRQDEKGELAVVQIDGALNPGNSGGPVVDAKGRLVGIAVATIKNGQGIGFAIPAAELSKMMKGRLGVPHLSASRVADGKVKIIASVGLIDPSGSLRGVTLHYVVVAPKGKKPGDGEAIEKQAGAKKAALKLDSGIASGEIVLDRAEGDIFVQAVPDGGPGAKGITAMAGFALAVPKGPTGAVALGPVGSASGLGAGEGTQPPPGWKEYSPRDKSYIVWIPEKAKGQSERERIVPVAGFRLKFNLLAVEMTSGPVYVIEEVLLPVALARKLKRTEMIEAFRDILVEEVRGRVIETGEAKMGPISGKEYRISGNNGYTRARIIVGLSKVFVLRVIGSKEEVEAGGAKMFLDSCRLAVVPKTTPAPKTTPGTPGTTPVRQGTRIQGGGRDPEFRQQAPDGGLLVGLEIGLGKFLNNDVLKSARPVFRVGEKETVGEWEGPTKPDIVVRVVKLVAKPGFAVGAITLKTGLGIDGLSVTFMRVADGKLDPKDSYESEWIGGKGGGGPVRLGGNGVLITGLSGKSRTDTVSGFGILHKGDKSFPPGRPTPLQGGGGDPEFREAAPAGGLLVGLEIGLGKFFDNDIVKSVRPIYRVGGKDSTGDWHGTDLKNVVKVVAKPGYAVAAISLKTGLGIDGLSITFMKVADGKLDPKENYESEWVGGKGGGGVVKVGGDGTLVTGLTGKANPRDVTGLGLLLKEEKK